MKTFEKIEKDVRHLGDMLEKQVQLIADRNVSELRAAFQGITLAYRSRWLQIRICRSLGLPEEVHPMSTEDLELIVKTMEDRGSNAADKIKSLLPDLQKFIDAVKEACPTDPNAKGSCGTGGPLGVVRVIRDKLNPS